jgi:DNA polymerase-3 subunit delta'
LNKNLFPWLAAAWERLQNRRSALPHALLIHGRAGLGKSLLASRFAQRLLCEGPVGDRDAACGRCQACLWFRQGNHPDFRLIQPEVLAEATTEESQARKRDGESSSRQIRVDQIRDIHDLLAIGAHRRGLRVVLIRPAEAMNVAAANALLKSLEEPPADTLFLLVSSAPDRLPPTVRSRCQSVPVAAASDAEAVSWLGACGVKDPEAALAYASNAPLAALEDAEEATVREALVSELAQGGCDALALADLCQGATPVRVVAWMQKWAADLALASTAGRVRYHLRHAAALRALAPSVAVERLLGFDRSLAESAAIAQHPLNPRLFLEDMFLRYAQLWGLRHG